MKFLIQLQVVTDDGEPLNLTEEIAVWEKGHEHLAEIGLNLSESKDLLKQLQQQIVTHQAAAYANEHRCCSQCGHSLAN